ncbi:hypothetical protein SANTM175S_05568 [Streptomyces antimycoticus]
MRSAMAAQSLGSPKILSHSANGEFVATAVALRSSRSVKIWNSSMLYLTLGDSDHCGIHPDGYAWAEIVDLPDPARLTADQRAGYACALCGFALYASRFVGTVGGHQLYACSPLCPTVPLARG